MILAASVKRHACIYSHSYFFDLLRFRDPQVSGSFKVHDFEDRVLGGTLLHISADPSDDLTRARFGFGFHRKEAVRRKGKAISGRIANHFFPSSGCSRDTGGMGSLCSLASCCLPLPATRRVLHTQILSRRCSRNSSRDGLHSRGRGARRLDGAEGGAWPDGAAWAPVLCVRWGREARADGRRFRQRVSLHPLRPTIRSNSLRFKLDVDPNNMSTSISSIAARLGCVSVRPAPSHPSRQFPSHPNATIRRL
ncbi:hypothetical protein BC830DRAFT_592143 [Chytriomyces sp. MP71]|nr:hypothetical protein BC830DRAFT_592143 [Chytriomyces sp. MP71]